MTNHPHPHDDHLHSHSDYNNPHDHPHPIDQLGHGREHKIENEHADQHSRGLRSWLGHLFQPHTHIHHAAALDPALSNRRGIWALKISLAGLLVTAFFQVAVVVISDSVALLADTLHNFSDALTAIPLWLAFILVPRARNRRYTYGYGRAEDLAGVLIVLMIFGSALVVFYESIQKIIRHVPMTNVGWVAAAAIIGFLGNELVAIFRIRVGREIGSAALVADGMHARTDGLNSLGVLAGAIGVWLGFPLADPLVGFAIGVAILWIVWGAAREMWFRMMDATDPALAEQIEATSRSIEGVLDVHDIAIRWLGHRQRCELHITVDCQLSTYLSHQIVEAVRHAMFHTLPALEAITVHVDPCECEQGRDYHPTAHHTVQGQITKPAV